MSTAKDEIGILGRLSNYSSHYFFSKLLRFLRERNSEDHHTMLHDARLREKRGSHTATLFLLSLQPLSIETLSAVPLSRLQIQRRRPRE